MEIPISPGCRIPMRRGFTSFSSELSRAAKRRLECVPSREAAWHSLPNVFFHPGKYGFVPTFAIERSEDPMSFVGKDESFGCHTVPTKRREKLKALIDGHAKILFVRDNQRWCSDSVRRQMRRAPPKMPARRRAPGRTAGLPVGEPEFFAFERHGFKIENAVMRNRRLESVGVPDEPVDRIATIARSCKARALRVDEGELRDCIEYAGEIGHDFATPVLGDFIDEFLAETK